MYGVRFQSVPVHFSLNGLSIQRTVIRQQNSVQPAGPATRRVIRSPHRSKWSMAADLLILEMVVIRQIHPERAEVCWRGIADTLVERGYLEDGVTAGAVKSRFFSIMHKGMSPTPLDISKVYDTIAIVFHDEPVPMPKQRNTLKSSQTSPRPKLEVAVDCANSNLDHKRIALRFIDHASLKGHRAQALGIHRSQRPDLVAQKRQAKSLHSEPLPATQIVMTSQSEQTLSRIATQLPTPRASSNLYSITSSTPLPTPKNSSVTAQETITNSIPSQKLPSNSEHKHRGTLNSSQPPPSSRKRVFSPSSDAQPRAPKIRKIQQSLASTMAKSRLQIDMRAIFQAEAAAAAKFREEQAEELRERQLKAKIPKGRLYLSTISYKHSEYKRETCFMRHRMESPAMESNIGGPVSNLKVLGRRKLERSIRKNSQAKLLTRRKISQNSVIDKVYKTTSDRMKSEKRKIFKETSKKIVKILSSQASNPDLHTICTKLSQDSLSQTRFDELLQRLREKNVQNMPLVDVNVVEKKTNLKKRDIVQEVYERVKQNRADKALKVARAIDAAAPLNKMSTQT